MLGLAEGDQRGVLFVKDKGGIDYYRFKITATHTSPIPEDTYAMIHIRGIGEFSGP